MGVPYQRQKRGCHANQPQDSRPSLPILLVGPGKPCEPLQAPPSQTEFHITASTTPSEWPFSLSEQRLNKNTKDLGGCLLAKKSQTLNLMTARESENHLVTWDSIEDSGIWDKESTEVSHGTGSPQRHFGNAVPTWRP